MLMEKMEYLDWDQLDKNLISKVTVDREGRLCEVLVFETAENLIESKKRWQFVELPLLVKESEAGWQIKRDFFVPSQQIKKVEELGYEELF